MTRIASAGGCHLFITATPCMAENASLLLVTGSLLQSSVASADDFAIRPERNEPTTWWLVLLMGKEEKISIMLTSMLN